MYLETSLFALLLYLSHYGWFLNISQILFWNKSNKFKGLKKKKLNFSEFLKLEKKDFIKFAENSSKIIKFKLKIKIIK